MGIPLAILRIAQIAGAVYNTYKIAKAALDALSTSSNTDHVDPVGNQTTDANVFKAVGLARVRQTVRTQEIPEAPRGQFILEFLLTFEREGPAQPQRRVPKGRKKQKGKSKERGAGSVSIATRGQDGDELIDATVELTPLWESFVAVGDGSTQGPVINLNAATIKVESIPYGESTAAGFLIVDGAQPFMRSGTQPFRLKAKITTPTEDLKWTKQGSAVNLSLVTDPINIDFDYFHLPWE